MSTTMNREPGQGDEERVGITKPVVTQPQGLPQGQFQSSPDTEVVRIEKPVVVHETRKPQEKIETQPIIYRDREVKEVRHIVQPMRQTEVRPAVMQTKGPSFGTREGTYTEEAEFETITKEPIIIETVKKRVIREIQPIIYREVEEPSVPRYQQAKPVAVVYGATGMQGGSVAKALLRDGRWRVRTLTRNPNSPRALKLASKGVEVVQGNQLVQEDLRRVLQGADLVFAVTDAGDAESAMYEESIGKQIAIIASECGCRHFIWSTLPNTAKLSGGKYQLPAFMRKAAVNKLIKSLNFPFSTMVMPSFYYQNLDTIFAPRREGNVLVWTLPMSDKAYLTAVDVRDLGLAVLNIVNNPQQFNQKKVALAGSHMHPQDYIIKRALVTGIPTRVELVSPLDFPRVSTSPKAQEIAQMMAYFEDFGLLGPRYTFSKSTMFPLKTYEDYLHSRRKFVQSQ